MNKDIYNTKSCDCDVRVHSGRFRVWPGHYLITVII